MVTLAEDGTRDVYEGTWIESMRNGQGKETYSNGDSYQGQFREGLFNGKGRYTWSNGSYYEGTFKNGEKHGEGKWVINDDNVDRNLPDARPVL